jgi:hypothetical protein
MQGGFGHNSGGGNGGGGGLGYGFNEYGMSLIFETNA